MKTLSKTSTSALTRLKEYHPSFSNHWALAGEDKIYGHPYPTIAQIINEEGFDSAGEWVCAHLIDMLSLSASVPDKNMLSVLSRTIAVRYKHLMLTEFMHFCFLYRTGEFSQSFSKPSGDSVMRALREYSRMREDIVSNLRQQAAEPQTTDRQPMTDEIAKIIADYFESEARRQGNWRKEPWGTAICRAYFVEKTLDTFPGDMTPDERRQWAEERGQIVESR